MREEVRVELFRDERRYLAGETLSGRVLVRTDRAERVRRLTLVRDWTTRGKGNPAPGDEFSLVLHEGSLDGPGPWTFPFELATPDRPFTYRGEKLEVYHRIRARLDVALGPDPKDEIEFDLVPGPRPAGPPGAVLAPVTGEERGGLRGCRPVVGAVMVVVGLLTPPVGLLVAGVGLFLLFPGIRRRVASLRVGEIDPVLARRRLAPGETVRIGARVQPRKDARVTAVTATLRGVERCVSGSGKTRAVHTHTVHETVARLAGAGTLAGGESRMLDAELTVPSDAGYSFEGRDNRLRWEVVIHVDIPGWPDWTETVPVLVWPAAAEDAVEPVRERPALPRGRTERTPVRAAKGDAARPTEEPEPDEVDGRATRREAGTATTPEAGTAPTPESGTTPTPESGTARSAGASAKGQAPSRSLGPSAADPIAAPPALGGTALVDAVRAVLAQPTFGGVRDARIADVVGWSGDFEIVVERVERSFGVRDAPDYRGGRSVVGTLGPDGPPVVARLPEGDEGRVDGWRRGDRRSLEGTVVAWERLRERAVVHVPPAGDPDA